MWGEKTVIGDVTQAAYLGPWLWKATVEKANSFDIDKVAASPGVEFKGAPEGYVRIHPNHHLWSKTRVGSQTRWPVRADLRDRRPGRARSVPEGLLSRASASPRPACGRSGSHSEPGEGTGLSGQGLGGVISPSPRPSPRGGERERERRVSLIEKRIARLARCGPIIPTREP